MLEKEMTILNKWGLHARAAWMLADLSGRFVSDIFIKNGNHRGNAKVITDILMLAAEKGSRVTLQVEGEDEEAAFQELQKLIQNGFYEAQ